MNSETDFAKAEKAALLQRLKERKGAKPAAKPAGANAIAIADRSKPLAMSWAQQRLWFLDQLDPDARVSYNMPSALRLTGRLDRAALGASLDRIVARHESLRTSFASVDGQPVQRIEAPSIGCPLAFADLRGEGAGREAAARRHIEEDAQRPFDLGQAPLIRAALLQLGDEEHILLINLHHIVSDGWSIGVLVQEFSALYTAFCQGQPDPLPPLAVQYADYAAWQREHLQGDTLERQVRFWSEHLAGAPALLELPTDHPRPALQGHEGSTVPFALPPALAASVRKFSQRHGVTLFMTLLGAWAVLMARLSGQQDVVIGSPFANRQSRDTEPLIGFFLNTLAIRIRIDDDPSVAELLARVKALTLDAYAHQDLPFEHVFEVLQPVRSLSHSPIFQVMLALNNTPKGTLSLPGLTLETLQAERKSAYFDLSLFLTDSADSISGVLEYSCALFERTSVERMAGQFMQLLESMASDDSQALSRLPLLDAAGRRQVLEDFNRSAAPHDDALLMHSLFEARAAAEPDAVAVTGADGSLSYRELNRRANRLAHALIAQGVRPDDRVAIKVERSLEMVIGLLGILKAGAGYVPLDPAYPADRLDYMVEDSAPAVVLTADAIARHAASGPDHNPVVEGLAPHNLAYVIYTSGSTGRPKGVMLEHRNAANLIQGHMALCGLTAADRVMQFASISFDNSIVEIFPCLSTGATLVLRPNHIVTPDQEFIDFLAAERITVTDLPTAFWHQWAQQIKAGRSMPGPHLRLALAGGEKAELRHLQAWFGAAALRGTRWINTYGPTEATVNASVLVFDADTPLPKYEIPIGRPVANGKLYILDAHGQPVPVGVAGEIHLGGKGIARGYLNRPELSAERFIPDPFSAEPGARMYKTGDLGRWLPGGTAEYLGRNDFQVKLRGFRIELGEIEARLAACEGVREAMVIAREDTPGDKRLVAYLLAHGAETLSTAELRAQLSTVLPEHMLPGAYVQLDAFPLSPNGKIDRKALPAPGQASVVAREYAAPVGPVEQAIAACWQTLLRLDRVGRNDHFFELGGHSLLVVSFVEHLRQAGFAASVRSVFAAPVLRELAAQLSAAEPAPAAQSIPPNLIPAGCTAITPALLPLLTLTQAEIDGIVAQVPGGAANIQDIYPLAPLQQGILFHHLLDQQGDAYLLRSINRFTSRARLDDCLAALQQVIDRHDSWRSAVLWTGLPQAVQVVYRKAPLHVDMLAPDGQPAMEQLLAATDPRHTRLDLGKAPLLSATVIEDPANGEWLMALLQHHLVTDHVTVELALLEMQQILQGNAARLPAPQPYRNFVAQSLALSAEDHESYFRERLGPVDEPTAPFGVLDTRGDGARVTEQVHSLPRQLAADLRRAARQHGVSAAVLFHVAWARVVAHCTGRDDVVFGTTLSGRMQGSSGAGYVFGMFINTLPLRVECADRSVAAAVSETWRRLGELLSHEQAPLALAQRCSGVDGSMPLFTSLLNYHHTATLGTSMDGGALEKKAWAGMHVLRVEERTNYPITVSVDDLGEDFDFITQCVEGIDACKVNAYFETALASLAAALEHAPARPLQSLEILPAAERARLLGADAATFDAFLLHQRFEQQVAATPEAVAVSCEGESLTYGALNRRANVLAHQLIAHGVKPDDRVAICMERGLDMLVGVFAILKSGGAYVPLDPVYPAERLAFTLADAAPVALLTQATLQGRIDAGSLPVLLADAVQPGDESNPVVPGLGAGHLAYVIYTSGSTGMPKGVMIEHAQVSRLFACTEHQFHFGRQDVWTLFHSFAFDFSVWEIFGALLYGGRLVVVPALCARSPQDFHALLCREGVTVLNQTPTAFRQLIAADAASNEQHQLRCIVFGGEALELHTLAPWIARHDPARTRLVNMYGITEITVHATFRELSAADIEARLGSVIGLPLADLRMLVLDRHRQPVPYGVSGEIYIGGAGVARGYLNRPELSAERFIDDPFHPGQRLYKTGDLGRWIDAANVEYLGRNDFQVKIRGFRIELGEIEARLAACAGVREAVVIAREDNPGDKRLVAYMLGEAGLSATALRDELTSVLPEHMVPAAFVQLDEFPLTPNGKLDRKALPAPEQSNLSTRSYAAPLGPVESAIAAIWQDLLKLEQVGRHDHFFELGGHSLLVVSMIERLRQQALAADVRTIFASPTVAGLAAAIGTRNAAEHPAAPNLIPQDAAAITPAMLPLVELGQGEIDAIAAAVPGGVANIQDIYPLAPLQEGILFHHLMETEGDAYLLRTTLSFDSRQRLDAFIAALQQVIDRHDVLRTAVHWNGLRQAVQVVQRQATLPLAELAAGADAHASLLAATDPRHLRMDLGKAPLMAATAVEDAAAGEWLLAILTHHLIDDNYTLQLILAEIKAILAGGAAQLPPSLPYRNFIAQVRSVPESVHEDYFRAQLGDVEEPTAPFGMLEIPGNGETMEEALLELSPQLAARIRAGARRNGVTTAVLFHAAWAQVLARCCGRADVVFGTTLSGRLQGSAGADGVLGLFINTLPVRIAVTGRSTRELVQDCYQRLGELLEHEQASLALAQRCSGVAAPMPLFSSLLNYRHTRIVAGHAQQSPLAGVRVLNGEERTSYPFTLSVNDLGDGFVLNAQCAAEIGAARIAEYMQCALDSLLESLDQGGATPAHAGKVLPDAEVRQALSGFNHARADYPRERLLHQLVEERAAMHPQAPAVLFEGEVTTYAELNARANQLAHRLVGLGVRPDDRVAICLDRSLDMVVGLLGIIKSGAAYVPIDPAYPQDRQAYMLADCAPKALLTVGRFSAVLAPPATLAVLEMDCDVERALLAAAPAENPDPAALGLTSRHLAYVIYTSGSTGKPKGAMNQHDGVVNRLLWARDFYRVGPGDRILQKTPFSFDVSVWEFFLPLLSGAQLVLARPDGHRDPAYLAQLMNEAQVTMLHFVPSMLTLFLEQLAGEGAGFPALRRVLCSGEALPPVVQERFEAVLPGVELHNLYGPTEAAIDVTAWKCDSRLHGGVVPIGRPIANIQIHILDQYLQLLPIGAVGEIHIGGIGVARGYLNRTELTQERFVADPFAPGGKLYKTGDLGRWLPDGSVEYLGRNDFQVKVRGFRIELGEIEARLSACAGVRQAVVIAREDIPGDKRLVGYVIGEGIDEPGLRASLGAELPDYMVPAAIVVMDAFPLSPNGKLERKLLPNPAAQVRTEAMVAPRNDTESAIAQVWKEILHSNEVGVHDDFFASGGHSLQAARLMFQINSKIEGARVSLLDFYKKPTVAGLAALVASSGQSQRKLLQSLLRSEDAARLTLVCCPYAGASAMVYQPLAAELRKRDTAVSLYAIAVPGNEVGTADPAMDSVERIAQACVDEICAEVSGPVALYGHCVGSNLALEITRRLELAGREVRFLAVAGALPAVGEEKLAMGQDFWAGIADGDVHRLIQSWGGSKDEVDEGTLKFIIANFKKDSRMAAQYEYARGDWTIQAPVIALFGTADPLTPDYQQEVRRWNTIAARVSLGEIDGGHHYFVGDQPEKVATMLLAAI